MPTYKDADGKKRHRHDGTCRRRCDHCQEITSVHETWRWGIESIGEMMGGGGLICLPCGHRLFGVLHEGAPSKERFDAEDEL